MFDLYAILVFVHILSAVVGLGPGFALIQIVNSAQKVSELKYAYVARRRLHVFVMIGGTMLFVTGLFMGVLQPSLFRTGWYVASLVLFFIALAIGPVFLSPKSKKIKDLLESCEYEEVPEDYERLSRTLFLYERIESGVFVVIIFLMVFKPL